MIGDAIKSALAQDYENLEIIVSDNCSTDGTEEVISAYASEARVKIFRNERNVGMFGNFKVAIENRATGKYFVNLCSDDLLSYPRFISDAVSIAKRYDNVSVVFAKAHYLDMATGRLFSDKNGRLYENEFRKGLDVFMNYSGLESLGWEGVMIDREKLVKLDIFQKPHTGFDLSSNLCLMLQGDAGFIDQYAYVLRVHEGNASTEATAAQSLANFNVIDIPYELASKGNHIEKQLLANWRSKFLLNRATDTARRLYMRNRPEYRKFLDAIKASYGINANQLRSDMFSRMFYSLYYFPRIGKFALSLYRRFLKTMK